ncbi:hypothetical protein ABT297_03045 [Dactylosporangium sp. NPDC000555]|uniref:hypothetical protein n=1 Tax=Dactylosporangium sp. NPDC000555 TaxID=3154260 RepID=UPI00332A10D8
MLPFPVALAVLSAGSVAGTAALLWMRFRRALPGPTGRVLVGLDLLVLRSGALVGVATAAKLTPALFIA